MEQPKLSARVRKAKGKGAVRKLRRSNQIPAVFYGPKATPMMLAVDYPELEGVLKHGSGENVILDLLVQTDTGTETRKAIIKDLMTDPVKDTCLHVDFYEISMDREITVDISIRLTNTPAGVVEGGVLQQVTRQLTVSCLPDKMIDALELDVSGLGIGDALHVKDIDLPEGIRTEEDEELTVALVAAPTVEEAPVGEEAAEEAEAAEAEAAESGPKAEGSEES
ncbi:MAG: 50S ribosomal protein L25 [Desulfatiglandaceae bacterium]